MSFSRQGLLVNAKRVLRLTREDNLLALSTAALRPANNDEPAWVRHRAEPDARSQTHRPDRLWVADITYVHLAEAFVYLAVVLDGFSRKVVGWALENHLTAALALGALEMALRDRAIVAGELIHHTDRGVQYACGDYIARLEAPDPPSMSRPGCPYDNAMAESFMKTLKAEEVNARTYADLDDARRKIGAFIEDVYNTTLRSALSYSPGRVRSRIPPGHPQPNKPGQSLVTELVPSGSTVTFFAQIGVAADIFGTMVRP